jgi:hypothetical protein
MRHNFAAGMQVADTADAEDIAAPAPAAADDIAAVLIAEDIAAGNQFADIAAAEDNAAPALAAAEDIAAVVAVLSKEPVAKSGAVGWNATE